MRQPDVAASDLREDRDAGDGRALPLDVQNPFGAGVWVRSVRRRAFGRSNRSRLSATVPYV